jgi:ribosomal protein S27AE
MPNHEEHCEESLRRYDKSFAELHKWMDEPSAILGQKHRKYRHDPNTTPIVARKLFGENADNACLDHIRLDELETRRKGSKSQMTVKVSMGNRKQPQNDPVRVGVVSIMAFIIGLLVYSQSLWGAIVLFIISFFGFLAFLGSLSSPKKEEVTPNSSLATETPKEGKMNITKTCPKCGTVYDYYLEKCPNCGQDFFTFHQFFH